MQPARAQSKETSGDFYAHDASKDMSGANYVCLFFPNRYRAGRDVRLEVTRAVAGGGLRNREKAPTPKITGAEIMPRDDSKSASSAAAGGHSNRECR